MKLPSFKFKLPSLSKLSGVFSRKKKSDIEDDFSDLDDLDDLDEVQGLNNLDLDASAAADAKKNREAKKATKDDGKSSDDEAADSKDSEDGADSADSADGDVPDQSDIPDFGDDGDDNEGEKKSSLAARKRMFILGGGGVAALCLVGGIAWVLLGDSDNAPAPEGEEEKPKIARIIDPDIPRVELAIAPPISRGGLRPPESDPAAATASASAKAMGGDSEAPAPMEAGADALPLEETGESLNVLATVGNDLAPGEGKQIPATTAAAYADIPNPPRPTPLTEGPDQLLLEQMEQAALPRIDSDGRQPWQVYARPDQTPQTASKVAIIVTGLGLSRAATEAAISKLPGEVTLAFNIYARGLDYWIRQAREAGHEVLLSLPMEPLNFPTSDAGPNALRGLDTIEDNLQQLNYVLGLTTSYVGVIGTKNAKISTDLEQINSVLNALKSRGLMFVDGGGAVQSLAPKSAVQLQMAWAASEMELDEDPSAAAIDQRLIGLEGRVLSRALAVARISPLPVSIDRLSNWLGSLAQKKIALVPVSALASKQKTN